MAQSFAVSTKGQRAENYALVCVPKSHFDALETESIICLPYMNM